MLKRWAYNGHTHCFRVVLRCGGREHLVRHSPSLIAFVCRKSSLRQERSTQALLRLLLDPDGDFRLDVNQYLVMNTRKEGWEPKATALFMIARRFLVDTTALLLSFGANVNVGGSDGTSPLQGVCVQMLDRLSGERYVISGKFEAPRMRERARRGMKVLKMLCEKHGARINAVDCKGRTPLSSVMKVVVKRSLRQRCLEDRHKEWDTDDDVKHTDKWCPVVIKFLLDRGACPHIGRVKDGETALHLAIRAERLDLIRMMMHASCGCEVDVLHKQGASGLTPLELAVSVGHPEYAAMLLEYGSTIDRINSEGERPLAMLHAITSGRLQDEGWFYAPKDDDEVPILVMTQQTSMFRTLYSHDSKATLLDTPRLVQFAARKGNISLVESLREAGVEESAENLLYSAALHNNYAALECAILTQQWTSEEIANALELHAAFRCHKARRLEPSDILKVRLRFSRAVLARQQSGVTKNYPAESTIQILESIVTEADTEADFVKLLEMRVWGKEKEPDKDPFSRRRPEQDPKLWPILGINLHALLVYKRILPFGHLGRLQLYHDLIEPLYPFAKDAEAYNAKYFKCAGHFSDKMDLLRLQDCFRLLQALFEEEMACTRTQILAIHPEIGLVAQKFCQATAGLLEHGIVVDVRTFMKWMLRFWPTGSKYKRRRRHRSESKETDPNILLFTRSATMLHCVLVCHRSIHSDVLEQSELWAAEMARRSHHNQCQPTVLHEIFYEARHNFFRGPDKRYLTECYFEAISTLLRHGADLNALNVDGASVVELALDCHRSSAMQRLYWRQENAKGVPNRDIQPREFLDEDGMRLMRLLTTSGNPIHWDMQPSRVRTLLGETEIIPQLKEMVDADLALQGPRTLQCMCSNVLTAHWYRLPSDIIPPRLAAFVDLHRRDRRQHGSTPKNVYDADRVSEDHDVDVDGYDRDETSYYYCLSEDDKPSEPEPAVAEEPSEQ